jgi:hypothetical protein
MNNYFYCIYERKKHRVPQDSICLRYTSNGQPQLVGTCQNTGSNVFKFIKHSFADEAERKYGKCHIRKSKKRTPAKSRKNSRM